VDIANNLRKSTEDFISNAKKIHKNEYDYSMVDYKGNKLKVVIVCKKHGKFHQKPNSHLCGQGCPICRSSRGEKIIRHILKNNNVKFVQQMKYHDCVHKNCLPFDFYDMIF
jgi:hypothetical protein